MYDRYPELGAQIPHAIYKILPGDPGIEQTLQCMRLVAYDAAQDPRLRGLGIRIVAAISPRNDLRRAGAILRWVQQNIRYVRDIYRCETIQWPQRTLIWKAGDCDDMSTLIVALLQALGFPQTGFVAQRRIKGGPYKHVFAVCKIKGIWYKLDGTGKLPPHPIPWDQQRHMLLKM